MIRSSFQAFAETWGSRRRAVSHAIVVCACIAATTVPSPTALAHETDQYTVPVGQKFADLDVYFSEYFRSALTKALKSINSPIFGQHLFFPHDESSRVASNVLLQFPPDLFLVERLEGQLRARKVTARFPNRLVLYRAPRWIYDHWALRIDLTKFIRLTRSSTVMANKTYFGTDKIAHFVHLGYLYFRSYRSARNSGSTEQAAVRRAVKVGTGLNPLTSERTLFGLVATGVFSNADLAVNYAGYKFFRNLTEPVQLGGKEHPPLLVRAGKKWRLNDYVRDDDRFFSAYISDHWDEVLNPSDYLGTVETFVREEVLKRCDSAVKWYRDRRADLQRPGDFAELAIQLRTYFGEDYGHTGDDPDRVTIAHVCGASFDLAMAHGVISDKRTVSGNR